MFGTSMPPMNGILSRIERDAGVPNLASILTQLPASDFQSLLLAVHRGRVGRRRASTVLRDFERNKFVQPAAVSRQLLLAWELGALDHLPGDVELMELSPVAPLGSCATVAPVSQDWVVSTGRNTEVVSDATNVLALQCALRRRQCLTDSPKSTAAVHLAASHRLLRGQAFSGPHMRQHFKVFSLCSAGRDVGNVRFESQAMIMHLDFHVAAVQSVVKGSVPIRISVTNFSAALDQMVEANLARLVRSKFIEIDVQVDQGREEGRRYYDGICFRLDALTNTGDWVQLVDGGAVDWTQRLLSNNKERLVISGLGSERLCTLYPPNDEPRTAAMRFGSRPG